MLIGLVIIGALVTLFVNTSGSNRELAQRQQHDRERSLRDQGAGRRPRPCGVLGRVRPDVRRPDRIDVPDRCADRGPRPLPGVRPGGLGRRLQAQSHRPPAAGLRRPSAAVWVPASPRRHRRPLQADTDLLVVRHAEHVCPARRGNCEADDHQTISTCRPAIARTEATPYVFDTSGFTADTRWTAQRWPRSGSSSPTSTTSAITR